MWSTSKKQPTYPPTHVKILTNQNNRHTEHKLLLQYSSSNIATLAREELKIRSNESGKSLSIEDVYQRSIRGIIQPIPVCYDLSQIQAHFNSNLCSNHGITFTPIYHPLTKQRLEKWNWSCTPNARGINLLMKIPRVWKHGANHDRIVGRKQEMGYGETRFMDVKEKKRSEKQLCSLCLQTGHYARDCKREKIVCMRCTQEGHSFKDGDRCTAPNAALQGMMKDPKYACLVCHKGAPNHLPFKCPLFNPTYVNLRIPKPKAVYPKRQQKWNNGIFEGVRDPLFDDDVVEEYMETETDRQRRIRVDAGMRGDDHYPDGPNTGTTKYRSYAYMASNPPNPSLPNPSNTRERKRAALDSHPDISTYSTSNRFSNLVGAGSDPSYLSCLGSHSSIHSLTSNSNIVRMRSTAPAKAKVTGNTTIYDYWVDKVKATKEGKEAFPKLPPRPHIAPSYIFLLSPINCSQHLA